MSDKKSSSEDISGLFSAFGGDATRYQEFDHTPKAEQGPSWTLLTQLGDKPQDAASQRAVAAAVPVPTSASVDVPSPAGPSPAQGMPSRHDPLASRLVEPGDLARVLAPDPGFQAQPVFAAERIAAAPPSPLQAAPGSRATTLLSATSRGADVPAASASGVRIDATPPCSTATATPGTPLGALFNRLASAPEPSVSAQHSLMAHWRQTR